MNFDLSAEILKLTQHSEMEALSAMRIVLGRIYEIGKKYPEQLPHIAQQLYLFAVEHDAILPPEMSFFRTIDDDYQTALHDSIYTLDEVNHNFLNALLPFKNLHNDTDLSK